MDAVSRFDHALRSFLSAHAIEAGLTREICFKFLLALVLAGALGLERERKRRAAGLRTHILVCLGATLAMVVADLLAREWQASGATVWLDKGRIAAGIITGIGFLGAGAIINVGTTHQGLTTAAMLWFAAALGIAIGAGYFIVAVISTAFVLFTVIVLHYISDLLPSHEQFSLAVRMPGGAEQIDAIEETIRKQGCTVVASRLRVTGEGQRVDMTFHISSRSKPHVEEMLRQVHERFPSAERIILER